MSASNRSAIAISSGPAVTTKPPIQSATPESAGATKSDRLRFGLAVGLGRLLADAVQAGPLGGAGLVGVDDDVVAVGVGRPEPDDRLRAEPVLGHDLSSIASASS